MQDNNQPERPHRRRKESTSLKYVVIPTLLILLFIAAAGIFFFTKDNGREKQLVSEPLEKIERTPPPWQTKPLTETKEEIIPEKDSLITKTEEGQIQESIVPETPEEKRAKECRIRYRNTKRANRRTARPFLDSSFLQGI